MRLAPLDAVLTLTMLLLALSSALDLRNIISTPLSSAAAADALAFQDPASADVAPGLEHFQSIVERPLFAASRKVVPPSARPSAAAMPDGGAAPTFDLVGIVAAGEQRLVLVRLPGAPIRRLAPGQKIGDWQLTEIGRDRATFTHSGVGIELALARRGAAEAMPVNEPWLNQPQARH